MYLKYFLPQWLVLLALKLYNCSEDTTGEIRSSTLPASSLARHWPFRMSIFFCWDWGSLPKFLNKTVKLCFWKAICPFLFNRVLVAITKRDDILIGRACIGNLTFFITPQTKPIAFWQVSDWFHRLVIQYWKNRAFSKLKITDFRVKNGCACVHPKTSYRCKIEFG